MNLSEHTWSIGDEIGRGSFGVVHSAIGSDGEEFAIKIQNLRFSRHHIGVSTDTLVELDSLVRLMNVPEVIKLKSVCYGQHSLDIILEKMDCNLSTYIKSTNLEKRIPQTSGFLHSMTRGITIFEKLNINHFDIGPSNILVKEVPGDTIFKITDFGKSRKTFPGIDLNDTFFTMWYRPPELLSSRERTEFSSFSGDVWALGMTVLQFIIGKPLVTGKSEQEVLNEILVNSTERMTSQEFSHRNKNGTVSGSISVENIVRKNLSSEDYSKLDNRIIEIVTEMLKLNPHERITGTQILSMFNDSITDDYLSQFVQPDYKRTVDNFGIDIILRLGSGKVLTLIALEIYTRFLYKMRNSEQYQIQFSNDVYALASIQIANKLFYDKSVADLVESYKLMFSIRVGIEQIAAAEKNILELLEFSIYNINLDCVIRRVISDDDISLQEASYEMFSLPVEKWFTNEFYVAKIKSLVKGTGKAKLLYGEDKQKFHKFQEILGLTDFSIIEKKIKQNDVSMYEFPKDLSHLTFNPNSILKLTDRLGNSYLAAVYYENGTVSPIVSL